MPTRHGKIIKKRITREHSHGEAAPKDKVRKQSRNNDFDFDSDFGAEMDWSMDEDCDLASSDELSPSEYDAKSGDNTANTTSHPHPHPTKPETLSSTAKQTSHEPTEPNVRECVVDRSVDSRQLPPEIDAMFPNIQSSVTLLKVLKKIQDEERRYSEPKDESGMRASKRKRTPFPRNHIIWHFDKVGYADLEPANITQIQEYIRKPILKQWSYGILLSNANKEVLAVQSHHGHWSAPKGHRNIKDNYQWETIKEAATRKFNEEICVKNKNTQEVYENYIDKYCLDKCQYITGFFDFIQRGDRARGIGLFVIKINEPDLVFDVPDTYENQKCEWLTSERVLSHKSSDRFDEYYTIRPFVGWLINSLWFDGSLS